MKKTEIFFTNSFEKVIKNNLEFRHIGERVQQMLIDWVSTRLNLVKQRAIRK